MHLLLFEPFTNEFDDDVSYDFFDKSLSYMAVWPCQLLCLGPRATFLTTRNLSQSVLGFL